MAIALVVDDNDVNRKLARVLLSKLDWEVEEADSGERAVELCKTRDFPLVLLDISMPGLSGEETCALLRAMGKPMRIVAYTAHAFAEERDQFIAAGFDEVLVKPINRATLEKAIAGG